MIALLNYMMKSRSNPERFSFSVCSGRAKTALDMASELESDLDGISGRLKPILGRLVALRHHIGHEIGCEKANETWNEAIDVYLEMAIKSVDSNG